MASMHSARSSASAGKPEGPPGPPPDCGLRRDAARRAACLARCTAVAATVRAGTSRQGRLRSASQQSRRPQRPQMRATFARMQGGELKLSSSSNGLIFRSRKRRSFECTAARQGLGRPAAAPATPQGRLGPGRHRRARVSAMHAPERPPCTEMFSTLACGVRVKPAHGTVPHGGGAEPRTPHTPWMAKFAAHLATFSSPLYGLSDLASEERNVSPSSCSWATTRKSSTSLSKKPRSQGSAEPVASSPAAMWSPHRKGERPEPCGMPLASAAARGSPGPRRR